MGLGIRQKLGYIFSVNIAHISGEKRKSNRILENYKGKYKGGRCFIVCNGPSLKASDLDMLKGEISFACNRVYGMYPETEWRPTFYALFDEGVAKLEGVLEGADSTPAEMKFFREQGRFIYHKFSGPSCYIHSWHSRRYLENPRFSEDLTKGIYTIGTTTYVMIELARYMGFNRIYIIGADHYYRNMVSKDGKVAVDKNAESYFGNLKDTSQSLPAGIWEMEIAYEYAEKYSREHGFRIYNATRGGHLEVFERVNLEVILADEAK